jgi:hypothetical protein
MIRNGPEKPAPQKTGLLFGRNGVAMEIDKQRINET